MLIKKLHHKNLKCVHPSQQKSQPQVFVLCSFQQMQQSTKAVHIPWQQEQVVTIEAVFITCAPIVGGNDSHNWNKSIDRKIVFVVHRKILCKYVSPSKNAR